MQRPRARGLGGQGAGQAAPLEGHKGTGAGSDGRQLLLPSVLNALDGKQLPAHQDPCA